MDSRSKPPTLRDVAQRAGVHAGTVSRALNPATSGRVSAATTKRVQKAAEALGYQLNPIARSLRTNRSQIIGMLIPDLTNPLFPPMIRGADRVLAASGYSLLLADTNNDADREKALFSSLRSRQVEGVIVGTALRHHPALAGFAAHGVPIVLVNRVTDDLTVPAVVGDEAGGVRAAVEHLASLGHREIACIAGPRSTSTGAIRLAAFEQAMRHCALPVHPGLVVECEAWTEDAGGRALVALLDGGTHFTAVVAGNDMIAVGCYDVIRSRSICCPGRLSIVGFNDMPFADQFAPALTTVRLPTYDLGAEAAQLLVGALSGQRTTAKRVTLPVELIIRDSTAPPGR